MNISEEDAKDSLAEIQDVMRKTRRAIASSDASSLLILWGVIWFLGFLGTQFLSGGTLRITSSISIGSPRVGFLWLVLDAAGFIITWWIVVHAPIRSPLNRRIFWLWFLLFLYAIVWLALFWPWNPFQLGAFVATIPMFAYVVMGLWFDDFLLWLGLAVTASIIIGFFLIQPYFWIWMAVAGGGSLAGTGLYIRKRW